VREGKKVKKGKIKIEHGGRGNESRKGQRQGNGESELKGKEKGTERKVKGEDTNF
jgi:hypothetical protein